MRDLQAGLLFSLLFALVFAGCEHDMDGVPIEHQQYDDQTPLFSTFANLNNSMIKWMDTAARLQNSSTIQYPFCIYTVDIPRDVGVENQVKEWSTIAMNTWLKPLIGQGGWRVTRAEAYQVERQGSSCPTTHNGLRVYHIRINGMSGANNHVSDLRMNMGTWGVHKLVVLHEMGHACGLADTYSWEGREPIGQPSATMNNVWVLDGVLQQDDIDAIRFVWARLRGATDDICPEGYHISQIKINGNAVDKGTWGESFCLPNEDNGDRCPNDPQKTAPGQCGCGVPDTDTDKDGTADCQDGCPNLPGWTSPGTCGCGIPGGSCDTDTGLRRVHYSGNWSSLPNFDTLRPDGEDIAARINVEDFGGTDYFGVVFTGSIRIESAGTYEFEIGSDDGSRLVLSGRNVVTNDGLHAFDTKTGAINLSSGLHDIRVEFFEKNGGERLRLRYRKVGGNFQEIPESLLFRESDGGNGSTNGLLATYYNNKDFTAEVLHRVDSTVDFDWGTGSPDLSIERDTFSARWTGFVKPSSSGTFTFYTLSDDGVRLWIDDKLVIDNWTLHAPTENSGTVYLQSDRSYPVKMEFYENGGGAVAKLLWSGPGTTKQVISQNHLSTGIEQNQCPEDPQKTAPGQCGCGEPEGTCDDGLAPADLVGYYERTPVANDWHRVTITLKNEILRWKNAAGSVWTLTYADEVLRTDATCPYGPKYISVEIEDGSNKITGLRFLGESYYRR